MLPGALSSKRNRQSGQWEIIGDWQKTQKTHFADGGTFDQVYKPGH